MPATGKKENSRSQSNNQSSSQPIADAQASANKKKRRKGKAIPSWSTFNAFKEQSKKIIALTPLVPRLTERQQMALLLKSNPSTTVETAFDGGDGTSGGPVGKINDSLVTPSKPSSSRSMLSDDPYGLFINIPLEEREVVFAPPSSSADLYRFFPKKSVEVDVEVEEQPGEPPNDFNNINLVQHSSNGSSKDDLTDSEVKSSMEVDFMPVMSSPAKRDEIAKEPDQFIDKVHSEKMVAAKDQVPTVSQMEISVETIVAYQPKETIACELNETIDASEPNVTIVSEANETIVSGANETIDANQLNETIASEPNETITDQPTGMGTTVSIQPKEVVNNAEPPILPSQLANEPTINAYDNLPSTQLVGTEVKSTTFTQPTTLDSADPPPVSSISGAPFRMHRIRSQTAYRDEYRKRFRAGLDLAIEQLDQRHNGRWNWCRINPDYRVPQVKYYLSSQDKSLIVPRLEEFPREFHFDHEKFNGAAEEWQKLLLNDLMATLPLDNETMLAVQDLILTHIKRMLDLSDSFHIDIERLVRQFLWEIEGFINGPHECHQSTASRLNSRQLRIYQLHFISKTVCRLIQKWEDRLQSRLKAFGSECKALQSRLFIELQSLFSVENRVHSTEWTLLSRQMAARLHVPLSNDDRCVFFFSRSPLNDYLQVDSGRLPFGRVVEIAVDLKDDKNNTDMVASNNCPRVLSLNLKKVVRGPWDLMRSYKSLVQYPNLRQLR